MTASPRIIIVRSQSLSTKEGVIFMAASRCFGSIFFTLNCSIIGRIREKTIAIPQRRKETDLSVKMDIMNIIVVTQKPQT
jgi:hypothetical protein